VTKTVTTKPESAAVLSAIQSALVAGRLDAAADQLTQAIQSGLVTEDSDWWHTRALVAYQSDQLDEAIDYWRRSMERNPQPHYRHNLASALCTRAALQAEAQDLESALVTLTDAVHIAPELFEAQAALGIVATALQRWDVATDALQAGLRLNDTRARIHDALGVLAARQQRWAEAIRHHANAIQRDSQDAEIWNNLGHALLQTGSSDKALVALEQSIAIKSDFAEAHNNLGNAKRDCGQFSAAKRHYLKALELKPALTEAEFNFADLHRYQLDDAEFTRLKQTPLPEHPASAALLLFARGKAFEDVGQADNAFASWNEANRLIRLSNGYDEAQTLRILEQLRMTLEKCGHRPPNPAATEPMPNHVFIVGAPRCGSTLLEQILTSHPAIRGIGERDFFEQAVLSESRQGPISDDQLLKIAKRYAGTTQSYLGQASGVSLIVDKFLANSLYLDVISRALPAAKIVVLFRDKRDLALSCFSKRFSSGHPYAYDLAELGRYLTAHDQLLDTACRHLPANSVLRIQYEEMVERPETVIRHLLNFLGVSWHPQCLEFHTMERIVTTASAQQVRQPINRHGIGRWQQYERHLGPLLEAL
jgi:tetratricopeptide (TPR) repeat protein